VRKIAFVLIAMSLFVHFPTGGSSERTIEVRPLGTRAPRKLVIIFMENHSASDVIGNADMPYLNAFAQQGVTFTHYTEGDPTGPSLPDYLQIAAGSSCGKTTDDVSAGDPAIADHCRTTVWNQLQHHRISWGVYMDGMPRACYAGETYNNARVGTPYALKHNPATPFASIYDDRSLCRAHVLPYTSLRVRHMPSVTFIAPGICNDQHGISGTTYPDCVDGSAALDRRGDAWLEARVPKMLAAGATVFITYDESGTLYAAEVGPRIASGTTDRHRYSHYSVLAAIERAYGLRRLGGARQATPLPL
jgi:hypothetical protein